MPPEVRLTDGIEIDLEAGLRVVADASDPDGDVNILTHAHGDHLYDRPPAELVCSSLTAALAAERRDGFEPEPVDHPRVTLLNSGHVPGATAALIEDTDATILYTGDVSTRDRFFLEGFEPVPADVLIIESTYGRPAYELPPQAAVEEAFVNWLNETTDRPVVATGYTLGRAQELQMLGARSDRSTVYVTAAIERMNSVIERHCPVSFESQRFQRDDDLEPGELLIVPGQTARSQFVAHLVERTGALRVGASGWAIEERFRYRGQFDRTFPLSDHCDFGELLDLVATVDPVVVYTTHGFVDDLARTVTSQLGYETRALRRNQATLDDFS